MFLSELKIKNMKPRKTRYLISDGGGLYIAVYPNGGKFWYVRFHKDGKERKISLGRYPDIGLKEARELKYNFKNRGAKADCVVFSEVAEEWLRIKMAPSCAERHYRDLLCRYKKDVEPHFGGRDINSIEPQELLSLLRDIETRSVYVAHRVRNMFSQIFRYAIATGKGKANPAADLAGALAPKPPEKSRATITTPQAAAKLLAAIWESPRGIPRSALLFLAYTFQRPGEVIAATWDEMDVENAVWRIPAEKMKMKREHIVPLSSGTLDVLRELTKLGPFVFSSPTNPQNPISPYFVSKCLTQVSQGEMTPHGFRGMASTLLHENGFSPDVIERQLAHVERNSVRAAYNHAEYLPERRKMMQWWADYLDGLTKK